MNDAIQNAKKKFEEAKYFLELMDKLEVEQAPLTEGRDVILEFTHLLSAFLNACYSCAEQLRREPKHEQSVLDFRKQHVGFYASGPTGGLRTRTVHYEQVKPEHQGYISPPGDNVIIRFRSEKPYSPPSGNEIKIQFGPGNFYFSDSGPQNTICDLCAVHLKDIHGFLATCV